MRHMYSEAQLHALSGSKLYKHKINNGTNIFLLVMTTNTNYTGKGGLLDDDFNDGKMISCIRIAGENSYSCVVSSYSTPQMLVAKGISSGEDAQIFNPTTASTIIDEVTEL